MSKTYTPLQPGERVQWACGHWLTAGSFGIQDVSDIPAKRCGHCVRRLQELAPEMLRVLEGLSRGGMYVDPWRASAEAIIAEMKPKEEQAPE